MKMALIVPGGVDRSGERRVIPALLSLIERLARRYELHVYSLYQERHAADWDLLGARIHNIGTSWTRIRAVRHIFAEHRRAPFGIIQAFFSGNCGLIAVASGRLLRVPSLVHVAGGELADIPDIQFGGRLTRRGRIREYLILRGARIVTAASQPMVATLAALGVQAQRVPLGVDRKQWPARSPERRPVGQARLVHVGSLNRVKDQSTLLRCFAVLLERGWDVHLDIVGEDTLDGEIQSLARQLKIDNRVTFHGFLTQTQLRPIMDKSHLLVMTSRHEAGPIVVLEAALAGVPAVGTAVGLIAEWTPRAARAAAIGDAAGLARLIEELLRREDERLELASEAQHRAVQEDADHTAGCFAGLYATLGRS